MSFNYFLALLLNEEVKNHLVMYGLDPKDSRLQHITPKHNLHLTVGYIGPLLPTVAEKVAKCFTTLEAVSPFQLSFKSVGFFGAHRNFKRYIAMTVEDSSGMLQQLHQRAQDVLKAETGLSFQGEDRRFIPHITFQLLKQRLSDRKCQALIEKGQNMSPQPFVFSVNKLALWYLNPQTQRYETVQEYRLGLKSVSRET